jgi:hypothetical protein
LTIFETTLRIVEMSNFLFRTPEQVADQRLRHEIDRVLGNAVGDTRPSRGGEPSEEDQQIATLVATLIDKRKRIFGASSWSLEQALALLIECVDSRECRVDEYPRRAIRALCKSPPNLDAFHEGYVGHPHAEAWCAAVLRCRDLLKSVGDRMAPLLWIRWALTHVPSGITPTFWGEFGAWRNETFLIGHVYVIGRHTNGHGMFVPGFADVPHIGMAIDAFIHDEMVDGDFAAAVNIVVMRSHESLVAGLVDHASQLRAREVRNKNAAKSRLQKATTRVGPGNMDAINLTLQEVCKREAKSRGWVFDEGRRGFGLRVSESLDEMTRLLLEQAARVDRPLKESVVRAGLGGLVNFDPGPRKTKVAKSPGS